MGKHQQTINNLKVLAARLAPTIYFNYLVLDWNKTCSAPVIKLYENKPRYIWFDDFISGIGGRWEGPDEEWHPLCIINSENLVGTSLGGLSENTDFSQFIIKKGN